MVNVALLTEEAADDASLLDEIDCVAPEVMEEELTIAVVETVGRLSGLITLMAAGADTMVTPTGADAEALTEASAWAQPVRAATVAAAMTMTRFMPAHSQDQVTQG
jgi:hypothetical protein